jgi:hypothetical protein
LTKIGLIIKDVALTAESDGRVTAHRVDCPAVQEDVAKRRPVLTLNDLDVPLPENLKRHSCLD